MKSENGVGFKPCHSRRVVRSNTEKTWSENNIVNTLQKMLFQANDGWLEPLLARVSESSSNVVTPVGNMITFITITISLATQGHTRLEAGLHLLYTNLRSLT